jgi:hypothetical protein
MRIFAFRTQTKSLDADVGFEWKADLSAAVRNGWEADAVALAFSGVAYTSRGAPEQAYCPREKRRLRHWCMTKAVSSLLALLAFTSGAPARSAEPFDPSSLQKVVAGKHTQVLVLGSPHLMDEPEHFDTKWLDPLLVRLGDYKPDVIVVEALPGEAVHALTQYQSIYPGVADMFAAKRITLARETSAALGTSPPEAEASARRVLEKWPGNRLRQKGGDWLPY